MSYIGTDMNIKRSIQTRLHYKETQLTWTKLRNSLVEPSQLEKVLNMHNLNNQIKQLTYYTESNKTMSSEMVAEINKQIILIQSKEYLDGLVILTPRIYCNTNELDRYIQSISNVLVNELINILGYVKYIIFLEICDKITVVALNQNAIKLNMNSKFGAHK